VGGALGLIAGFAFSFVAAPYIQQSEFTAFLGSAQSVKILSPVIIGQALLFSIFVACLAGLYPAWKASRLSPVEAISYE
jgi:putative ABC transport system permease protein